MRYIPVIFLLLTFLACSPGESGKVRPVGASTAVQAAPDTVVSETSGQSQQEKVSPGKKAAQRAWDTAAPESFDVEELNRRRVEWIIKNKPTNIDTVRIKPAKFPGLPVEIASWLEEKGYIIPQTMFNGRSNVILGEYMIRGQQDVAVLAMRDTLMDVLVFEKSTTDSVHTLIKNAPGLWGLEMLYHSVPDSTVRLLYGIETLGTDLIEHFYKSYDWPEPPEIAHQAIWYSLLERNSRFFYYHNGEWIEVQKAD